jgi:outer membrane lipoprotein LolB
MRRYLLQLLCLAMLLCVAGCASTALPPKGNGTLPYGQTVQHWQGRIGVKVIEPQPQSFSAYFELDGNAEIGMLRLTSPIGITLALMQWAPGNVSLTGTGAPRQFDSLSALTQATIGLDIPMAALFDWLQGTASQAELWEADLTELGSGKLTAKRTAPDLRAEIKLLIEMP